MSPDEKQIARLRAENAREALLDARLLVGRSSAKGATNRAYYACFYAVNALLYCDNRFSSKHSGVRALFNQHYVHKGIVSAASGDTFNKLFDSRMDLDYGDLEEYLIEQAAQWVDAASAFVDEIVALVDERLES